MVMRYKDKSGHKEIRKTRENETNSRKVIDEIQRDKRNRYKGGKSIKYKTKEKKIEMVECKCCGRSKGKISSLHRKVAKLWVRIQSRKKKIVWTCGY